MSCQHGKSLIRLRQVGNKVKKILIIAEAGVNHNGSKELAFQLVDEAVNAGADIIKFQTFKSSEVASQFALKAEYQENSTSRNETQRDMLKKLELSYDEFRALKIYCEKKGIEFLSTPFDLESMTFLSDLKMRRWKIPSGEITNYPYLVKIAKTELPVILSTGMSTLEEIESAIKVLKNNKCGPITLLHCTTEYPAPIDEINLRAMQTLGERFNVPYGYSDHSLGIVVPIAAAALGACVIEKHFTLDKDLEGPDHKASLDPRELKKMISSIRMVENSLGDGIKQPTPSEMKNRVAARKSIVAKVPIRKGTLLTADNLAVKRPGNGISPMRWEQVIGTIATRDFDEDEMIDL